MRPPSLVILLAACSPGAELAALAEKGATCSADGDCCAVMDGCAAHTYVVGKADFEKAKQLAAENADGDGCAKCIAPLVDVRCNTESKRCEGRGVRTDDQTGQAPDGWVGPADHCGTALPDEWPAGTGQVSLGCGAG